jgi:hypothetical protein
MALDIYKDIDFLSQGCDVLLEHAQLGSHAAIENVFAPPSIHVDTSEVGARISCHNSIRVYHRNNVDLAELEQLLVGRPFGLHELTQEAFYHERAWALRWVNTTTNNYDFLGNRTENSASFWLFDDHHWDIEPTH